MRLKGWLRSIITLSIFTVYADAMAMLRRADLALLFKILSYLHAKAWKFAWMSKSERFKKILKKVLTSCLEKIKIRTIREVVNEFVF